MPRTFLKIKVNEVIPWTNINMFASVTSCIFQFFFFNISGVAEIFLGAGEGESRI